MPLSPSAADRAHLVFAFADAIKYLRARLERTIHSSTGNKREEFATLDELCNLFRNSSDLVDVLTIFCTFEAPDADERTISGKAEGLARRIVGDTGQPSMVKHLAAFVFAYHEDLKATTWSPGSTFCRQIFDSIQNSPLRDDQFAKRDDNYEEFFGKDLQDQWSLLLTAGCKFNALLLEEEKKVAQGSQRLPIMEETRISSGNDGEIFRCTLAPGVIKYNNGSFSLQRTVARKLTDRVDEWETAKGLMSLRGSHKHIREYIACVDHGNGTYSIFMEYCDQDLASFWKTFNSTRQFKNFLPLLVNLLDAYKHCHCEASICLLDIHDKNILVVLDPETGDPKRLLLADFGSAQRLEKAGCPAIVNQNSDWISPELSKDDGVFHEKSDIWPLGCLIASMLVWVSPRSRNLDEFQNERKRNGGSEAFFFEDEKGRICKNRAVRKRLYDCVRSMQEPYRQAARAICDLVINDMLCLNPDDRKGIEFICKRMEEIVRGPPRATFFDTFIRYTIRRGGRKAIFGSLSG